MASPEATLLVDKGFTSEVFAWGEGRVLKLFHKWVPAYKVEREYKVTQALHAAGFPAPATYERVAVQGRLGIVFERVEGLSLFDHVQTNRGHFLARLDSWRICILKSMAVWVPLSFPRSASGLEARLTGPLSYPRRRSKQRNAPWLTCPTEGRFVMVIFIQRMFS